MEKIIAMEIGTWLIFIIIISIFILILIWCYIKSAVKTGTKEAIQEIVKEYNLLEYTKNYTEQKISENRPDSKIH